MKAVTAQINPKTVVCNKLIAAVLSKRLTDTVVSLLLVFSLRRFGRSRGSNILRHGCTLYKGAFKYYISTEGEGRRV
jgi:hypothetical protein